MKIFYMVLSLILVTVDFSFGVVDEREYRDLDQIALEAGTDKSSAHHNYTKVYADYFASLRDRPIKFLEIGIYKGHSVKCWERYFTRADLYFMDISSALIEYYSDRSHYFFLDQSSPEALQNFLKVTGGEFDVIIDDGGHTMEQQLNSFVYLFPGVKKGGLYIIEDLHTSYWKTYGGKGTMERPEPSSKSMTEYLKKLVDAVNYTGARFSCADHEKVPPEFRSKLTYMQEHIYSIHFYDSLCIIIKR